MNTPNPLVPQGSLERQSKGTSTVRIAIFTIVSIHAVFFAGLLMQGCRRDENKASAKNADIATNQNALPALDPGYYPSTQEVAQTPPPPVATNIGPSTVPETVGSLPPAAAPEPLAEGKTYSVVKGDTLAKIARAHGVTVGALTKANPNLDSKLRPGQKLQIPPAPTSGATAALGFKEPASPEGSAKSATIHKVKPGETLTRIAKQHGTTVKAIRTANNLKSDRLLVGQKLKLPPPHPASASTGGTKTASVASATTTNPTHVTPVPATTAH